MAIKTIEVIYKDQEVGKLGLDDSGEKSYFQYNREFLKEGNYRNLFPYLIKKTSVGQAFANYQGETFRGLPPVFADSLPDLFGNMVFREWLNFSGKNEITALEQLAYVGKRGMGALEYRPAKVIQSAQTVNIEEISELAKRVVELKSLISENDLSHESLINMFKIGTSAGGARPKILVAENKLTGKLIPGDVSTSDEYNHYLVKLAVDDEIYSKERIEYSYYELARSLGLEMMDSKLISGRHFCTLRFDRQGGGKRHILTASGMTGWDFKNGRESSYENLFKLCSSLRIPHSEVEILYKRMVFNVVYMNIDDHLKNFSFIYHDSTDHWSLAPAYDLTYALNPLQDFTRINRALSINGKRNGIKKNDLVVIADTFGVKNAKDIIERTISKKDVLIDLLKKNDVNLKVVASIQDKVSNNITEIGRR